MTINEIKTKASDKSIDENDKLKVLFESIKNKSDFLLNADNCLDQKSATLMGINVAIIIGYVSLAIKNLDGLFLCLNVLVLLLLVTSACLLLKVGIPREYTTISIDIERYPEYLGKSERDLILQLISDAQNAFKNNKHILKEKTLLYKQGVFLLLFSASLSVLLLIIFQVIL